MKLIATMLLATAAMMGVAQADQSDDYVACLVGKAAVELHSQTKKDGGAALEAAYKKCEAPAGIEETELEGIGDYVNMQVEAMASNLGG